MSASAPYVREQMVTQQLRTWDVLDDAILDAVRSLPRESFVPAGWKDVAYADVDIPLPGGERMLAPKVVGRILQALKVAPGEQVLEVGTGSGFLSACFARLGAQVQSVEVHAELVEYARRALAAAGVAGPQLRRADIFTELDGTPRYDAIAVTGSLPVHDARFEAMLKPGGRLFVVVGEGPAMDARLITRTVAGGRAVESLFETQLPALINAPRTEGFRF